MQIRVLVCGDDPRFVCRLVDFIHNQPSCAGWQPEGCASPENLTEEFLRRFHIILLDMDMHARGGIRIAQAISKFRLGTVLIFLAMSTDYLAQSYSLHAFRYLLKQDIETLLPDYLTAAEQKLYAQSSGMKFILHGEPHFIKFQQILYLESHQRIVYLHCTEGSAFDCDFLYARMEEMERRLAPFGFVRIHRSYIVNIRHLQRLHFRKAILAGGTALPVSRKRYSDTVSLLMDQSIIQ